MIVSEIVSVRSVEVGDAAVVAELSVQLGYIAHEGEMRTRIARLLAHPEEQVALVACVDGVVIGWIEAVVVHHLQSAPHTLIGGLVVKDGARGLGVGRTLCAAVEVWTKHKGLDVVRVTSRSTREAAHRFYLRDGYVLTKSSAVFEKVLR